MNRRTLIGLTASLLPLAACAGGSPLIVEPRVATSWGDAARAGAPAVQDAQWWRALNDPVLDQLIAIALADSPDLEQAAARRDQAAARMRASGASRGPQAGVSSEVSGVRLPPDVTDRVSGLDPEIAQARLQLQAGWELDFWSKAANAARAEAFGYLGAQETIQAARASLIGDIAAAYVELRVLDARLEAGRRAEADLEDLLGLAQARHGAGVADASETIAAEAERAQQAAQLAELEAARAQTRHALALLVGRTDEDIGSLLAATAPIPVAPPAPGAGLPNDLLRNRPDVLQAEYAVLAQYARLESARADLYPSFSLSGALGTSSSTLGDGSLTDLFSWDQRLLSAGLSITMPLFNRGKLVAQVDLQDAALVEAVAAYEKVVLAAQKEVLDALSQDVGAREAATRLTETQQARQRQVAHAQTRRDAGVALRTEVLDANLALNASRDADAQARGDVLKAWIALHRALGTGGRDAANPPSLNFAPPSEAS